jgi:PKD domain/Kelch motif
MKLFFSILLLAIVSVVNHSCKKDKTQPGTGKPPVANAGSDRTITLPTDSVLLDGSLSIDPDGSITEWKWLKISGPSSFAFSITTISKPVVRNLQAGIYRFELLVKDNEGLSAKDTVQITVSASGSTNQPPVANAGSDQSITLPTNTVILSGNNSTDPDNNITNYVWAKVSGPGSVSIFNSNASQTQVNGLEAGIYFFELTVTDAGGLIDKDSVRINVESMPVRCDNSNRQIVSASLVAIGNLSRPRLGISAASTANKIVFGGGFENASNGLGITESSVADIYDPLMNTWSTGSIGVARTGSATAVSGNKVFLAGGGYFYGDYHSQVAIYDAQANNWTYTSLSEPKAGIAAASVGNKILFAGGYKISGDYFPDNIVNTVEVYDLVTSSWSTAQLSQGRGDISAVTINNKVYFAGGSTASAGSAIIDIYDNTANSWAVSSLQFITAPTTGIAVGDKIYWTSGCQVEIVNTSNGTSTIAFLSYPGVDRSVIKDGQIIFLRTGSALFDIYDPLTGSWKIGSLSQPILPAASIISVNNTIYVAGGQSGCIPIPYGCAPTSSAQVYKLEF